MTLGIGLEQFFRRAYQLAILRDQSETATALHIGVRQIERQYIQLTVIDNHHLPVIAHQVIGRAGHGYTGRQKALFELAQALLAGAIRMCDECVHGDAAAYRISEGSLQLALVETENHNFDAFLSRSNALDEGLNPVPR